MWNSSGLIVPDFSTMIGTNFGDGYRLSIITVPGTLSLQPGSPPLANSPLAAGDKKSRASRRSTDNSESKQQVLLSIVVRLTIAVRDNPSPLQALTVRQKRF